ncbi:hydrogenase nickel incorporation protein HypB [Halopolyspora algeriensis]|uniref:Hydrogenase nickel incorporation protein HypB n=1 Tax=Halopolyspora algeriensis TaxID=1500506 RepID=A0A368VGH5_9ACTN|nr:hydrogenase nickel incorporation protein HypB [Halopolyspora algeriensis]RCW40390.1 hydrogenase nickel incorporation protein HypB [Halopolyspora algeriensis]TQM53674.1 hydrogenase nickel incorporation protein HypB [Halopolyspora algeriensis]
MCGTCGCSDEAGVRISGPLGTEQHREQGHGHGHGPGTDPEASGRARTILLEQDVLAKNDRRAQRNRAWLADRRVLALNLMSSPGSGKTTLLERTLRESGSRLPVSVIEGDQETLLDADRLRDTGCAVVQINTGAGCHLDADMLAQGLSSLDPPRDSVVLVENVGNLVCPALFDLGEHAKVVIASVTEGEDKPLKYPHMFRATDLVLLNKTDLLPHLDYDVELFTTYARKINPHVRVLPVSAATGDGLADWYTWMHEHLQIPEGSERRLSPAPAE